MIMVHVYAHIKPEFVEAFKAACIENGSHSIQEPGIARFDVIQQLDDPNRFMLIEVYRTEDAPAKHRETAHFKKWMETVADMVAEPRYAIRYRNVFPGDEGW
jgi:quinol monooxygenase YgiN